MGNATLWDKTKNLASAAAGFVPAVGEAKDLADALAGYDAVTRDKLTEAQRWMSFAALLLSFVGGGLRYADEIADISKGGQKLAKQMDEFMDAAGDAGVRGTGRLKIIDGKVGGKVPVEDFEEIGKISIKNPDTDMMTLGKFSEGPDSYIARAGSDSSYFDLGYENWGRIQSKYGLDDTEMFEYFNVPALDDAMAQGKTIRFSHDPRLYKKGAIVDEWIYLKEALDKTDTDLIFKGGYWYVK